MKIESKHHVNSMKASYMYGFSSSSSHEIVIDTRLGSSNSLSLLYLLSFSVTLPQIRHPF